MDTGERLTTDDLLARLREASTEFDWQWEPTEVISRSMPSVASPRRFFHSELIAVKTRLGDTHQVFAKTGPAYEDSLSFRGGLSGGLGYEYECTSIAGRAVCDGSVPGLLGHSNALGSDLTLFFEYRGHTPEDPWTNPSRLDAAVAWLINFHAISDGAASSSPWLNRYSEEFLSQWAKPFADLAHYWGRLLQISRLDSKEETASILLADARRLARDGLSTLVHGDFYVNNTLDTPSGIVVIDWELAAIASGAIDIATITLGWDSQTRLMMDSRFALATAARTGIAESEVMQSICAARRLVIARLSVSFPPHGAEDIGAIKKLSRRLRLFSTLLAGQDGPE